VDLLGPGRQCLATWRGDGHPDHEAVGRAAAAACARTGAVLWEYPIWMWHWTRPADPRVPWRSAHRIPLDRSAVCAKAHAIAAFTSQITDIDGVTILPPEILARFDRPFEVLFR
jgi:LmbE family N-acetylglucosaminyl deacetylase